MGRGGGGGRRGRGGGGGGGLSRRGALSRVSSLLNSGRGALVRTNQGTLRIEPSRTQGRVSISNLNRGRVAGSVGAGNLPRSVVRQTLSNPRLQINSISALNVR